MTAIPYPKSLWRAAVACLGLAWNGYGIVQFIDSLQATQESLMANGMSELQAQVMLTYPVWMTLAFAVGTFGGTVGCVLLLMRSRWAQPVLAASLAAYVLLYIGDITNGVFAALGAPQIIVLSLVVLIAAGLLWLARESAARGLHH